MAFHFKEFSVDDSACAMKVGTDSVLLGAWADFSGCSNILDIGTGCGLLALMAAQESNATITAIDIDVDSCRQAEKNFRESSWSDRLKCIPQGLEEFTINRLASRGDAHDDSDDDGNHMAGSDDAMADSGDHLVSSSGHVAGSSGHVAGYPGNTAESGDHMADTFDHIITNPPYFINSLKSPDSGRNTARHNDGLPLKSLMESSSLLLKDLGKLSVVFPYADSSILISLAAESSLRLSRQLIIIPKQGKEPNRVLLEFKKGKVDLQRTKAISEVQDYQGSRVFQGTKAISEVQDTSAFGDGHFAPGNRADQHKYTTLTIRERNSTLTIRDRYGRYTQEYINLTERFYLKLS